MCFFYGRFVVIEVFSDAIVDEACSATDVLLIVVVTRDLVDGVSS